MFLRKIAGIKAVGRFRTGGISGGEYGKYTLFYAGNGRGKTTLCSMLRSLQTNDPSHLLKRRSFKAAIPQEVQLLMDTGLVKFSAGAWSANADDFHIFDQHFINANVHGGHEIDVVHRRNFYRVVVGPQGVLLAEEIDALDAATTAKQLEITNEKKVLQQHIPKGMTLEAFLKLPADAGIDGKIAEAEKALKAVEAAADIAAHAKLKPVALPALPPTFEAMMGAGLPEVSAAAAGIVQAQLATHGFHDGGEAWLAEGIPYIHDDKCPFCGSEIAGSALVTAYQGYFSEAYEAHKAALVALAEDLEASLGPTPGLKFEQGFKDAAREGAFWAQYLDPDFVAPAEPVGGADDVAALYAAALVRMRAKLATPLDAVTAAPPYDGALATWEKIAADLEPVNAAMVQANVAIEAVKAANAKADKAVATAKLAALKATKKRHMAPFADLAAAYDVMIKAKEKLVADKDVKKAELDVYDAKILGGYEADINAVLTRFNAGFRLAKCGKNYVGKTPQSAYCLQFDGNDVDISKADGDEPSFDSTMSAGDKSTFAMAFFLVQLNRDPKLANKIVVFDDPFTSLDDFRREMTAKAIVRVGETASQVLVFSHDKYFLDAVRRKIHGPPCVTMQISGSGGNSALEPWNIDWEVKEGYLQDHMALADYASGVTTDAKAMRTTMRPLLEKYIRYRFPNQNQDGLWLGDMLQNIRADPQHPLTQQYQELDDINEYTAPFHHDPNTAFDADEVLAHAKRTLAIVGGC
ncbi:MAG: AAA family ATPase [Phenylobacterium sp.]|uniref:AAA family ATPase n=1 Tax=Phenylobacterium sp. TaxID=1871053 RepID=UPI00271DA22B|nr:AAA family ATPase [Phenylobacterium sp.]MDO9432612.1 AAA family ATPase [Phenylobacterium sp.]